MSSRLTTLDEDVKRKMLGKLDQDRALYALLWIEEVTGNQFEEEEDFHSALKSGVALCEVAQAIHPGSIPRISKQNMAFKHRDNISSYLRFCRRVGLPQSDLFEPDDLYEAKNLVGVLDNIYSLGGHAQHLPGFEGPVLGPSRRVSPPADQGSAVEDNRQSAASPAAGRGDSQVPASHPQRAYHRRSSTSLRSSQPVVISTTQLDDDIRLKLKSKLDPIQAMQAQLWLETLCGEEFPEESLHQALKSGERLCKAMNTIKPGSIRRINPQGVAFKELENITQYLRCCRELGLTELDLFDTQDLHDGHNLATVVDNIFALGGVARDLPEFQGPYIGSRRRNTLSGQPAKGPLVQVETPTPEPESPKIQECPACSQPLGPRASKFCPECGHSLR